MTAKIQALLPKVKANLILTHDEDDELIMGYIRAALDYAQTYQKVQYGRRQLPPSTEQAIIILASHWYESRDGSTGGFFGDTPNAAVQVWNAVHRLLSIHKEIVF